MSEIEWHKCSWTYGIVDGYVDLLENFGYTDFEIITCDGVVFPVHKCYMAAVTRFFRTLLNQTVESQTNVLNLKCITSHGLRPILKQLYTNPCDWNFLKHVNESNVYDVYHAANFLQVHTDIAKYCIMLLKAMVEPYNALDILSFAKLFELTNLIQLTKDRIETYLINNINGVNKKKAFTDDIWKAINPWEYLNSSSANKCRPFNLVKVLVETKNFDKGPANTKLINWAEMTKKDIDQLKSDPVIANTVGHSVIEKAVSYTNANITEKVVMQLEHQELSVKSHLSSAIVISSFQETPLSIDNENSEIVFLCSDKAYRIRNVAPFRLYWTSVIVTVGNFLFILNQSTFQEHICWLFDPLEFLWYNLGMAPRITIQSQAVACGSDIYLAGTLDKYNSMVFKYCLTTLKWFTLCAIPRIQNFAFSFTWGNKLYYLGVCSRIRWSGNTKKVISRGFVEIDPKSGKHKELEKFPGRGKINWAFVCRNTLYVSCNYTYDLCTGEWKRYVYPKEIKKIFSESKLIKPIYYDDEDKIKIIVVTGYFKTKNFVYYVLDECLNEIEDESYFIKSDIQDNPSIRWKVTTLKCPNNFAENLA